MGICGKIFVFNLHNLQVLCLRIKFKFSECPAPLHKHEAPSGRLSGNVLLRPADTGGQCPQIFCALPNFVVLRKICFKHMIKTKLFPPKNILCSKS